MNIAVRPDNCQVAVVGAGPYGLATAAHLQAAGLDVRVFGDAMSFWRWNMPKGMRLRSAWNATHISDPDRQFSLDVYAREHGIERAEMLPLERFIAYGQWFQARTVPDLDRRAVTNIAAEGDRFRLALDDGENLYAERVVVAVGLAKQEFKPAPFKNTPVALVSHTCDHKDLGRFRGQRIAVIGRGQSACESAALLNEGGADVELIARGNIHWLGSEKPNLPPRSMSGRLRKLLGAPSGVGPFPLSWMNEAPGIVHSLPANVRRAHNTRSLRAAAAAWLKPRLAGVRIDAGRAILAADIVGDAVTLRLDSGARTFDHVLLATGYRIDVSKLDFLSPSLLARIANDAGSPVLSRGFQSSVPGLHFVGSSAVKSFGPLMRFVAGSGYAAREVTQAIRASGTPCGARSGIKGGNLVESAQIASR